MFFLRGKRMKSAGKSLLRVLAIALLLLLMGYPLVTTAVRADESWQNMGLTDYVLDTTYDGVRDKLYASTVYSQSQGGVRRCDNPSSVTEWSNVGSMGGIFYNLDFDSVHNKLYAGGRFTGVWRCDSPDTSPVWVHTGGPIATARIDSLFYDVTHNVLYAGVANGGTCEVWRCDSPDSAPNWKNLGSPSPAGSFVYDSASDILYVGTWDKGVLRCRNPEGSPAWDYMGGATGSYGINELVYDAARGVIYAGTFEDGVWRCNNPETSNNWVSTGAPASWETYALALDPESNVLFAGFYKDAGKGVWRCDNPATSLSWTDTGGAISAFRVVSLEYDTEHNALFAGAADKGVWSLRIDVPEYYAVIVGIGHYTDGWNDLILVDQSAKRLRDNLVKDQQNWRDNVAGDNIELMTSCWFSDDTVITKEKIRTEIQGMVSKADENDICLFYFCGHAREPSGSLVAGDGNGIFYDHLVNWFFEDDDWKKKTNAVIILDSCYSGNFKEELKYEYCNLLMACDKKENAAIGNFSGWLSDGLGGSADGFGTGKQDGWITAREAFDYAENRCLSYQFLEHPQYLFYGKTHNIMRSVPTTCFAEGTTRSGFTEWICLQNSSDEDTLVEITYMLGTGENKVQQVTVPARTRKTVDVAAFVGPDQDVSAKVESKGGPIQAERPMYFNYGGVWSGGHDSSGVAVPSSSFYFAEGTTRGGFDTYLCLQNPREEDVEATITYMLDTGETLEQKVGLPKKSRVTVKPADTIGLNQDFSTHIEAPLPIVAERPMYFSYANVWSGGHDSCGTNYPGTTYYFPEGTTREGYDTYICLQNPGPEDTEAAITYMLDTGENVEQKIPIPKTSRVTVKPVDVIGYGKDMSTIVTCETPIVAERPMYFAYQGTIPGGHVSPGAQAPTYPCMTLSFAEGTTRPGYDQYICIMNPGDQNANITLTYMLGTGENVPQQIVVPARTRATVHPVDILGGGQDVSTTIESDVPIVAERPLYFSTAEGYMGGHCCLGEPR